MSGRYPAHSSRWFGRVAAAGYTACFVAGSFVSIRRGLKGTPLGLRTPFSVGIDVTAGFGAALAPPWPMVVGLWMAELEGDRPGEAGRRARGWIALLAAVFLAGATAEPISHRLVGGRLRSGEAALATLNLCLPVIILSEALMGLANEDA